MQAIAVQGDTFWGVQYHPEYNIHELARLTATRAEVLIQYVSAQLMGVLGVGY